MSEQGGGKRDVSPRRASMKSDKASSKERGSRGELEIVEAVSCDRQPVPSTSQLPPISGCGAQPRGRGGRSVMSFIKLGNWRSLIKNTSFSEMIRRGLSLIII